MAEPMAMLGIGSSIIGGGISAIGAAQAGSAGAASYRYQSGIAMLNAQIAEQNATYASVQGERTAMQYGMKARQQSGEIVAQQGASGLSVTSGSNKEVQTSQATVSKMDMDTIRMNAAKTAYDYRVQAASDRTEANLGLLAAKNAESATGINIASSILGGASSVADKWFKARELGLLGG